MGRHEFVNGKLDDSNYSSPMPLIGLYVVAATLVCLAFMLLDILSGFRNKKRWIPCHLFSLNSVILTLLSVAVKLPLDLTTPLPRAQDQLSKLSGTTLMCISMGFLMPSLGTKTTSECFSNMVAMSIQVVTIIVNICIQLHTGVIFSFHGEHITVLCCMMLLLIVLWFFAPIINNRKEISVDHIKEHLKNGQGDMLQRLKVCYLCCYNSNPQFLLCNRLVCPTVCAVCVLCSVFLVRATIQSLVSKELQFCEGTSVYEWSMWIIVVSQIITVLVGCFGTIIRLFTMADHVRWEHVRMVCGDIEDIELELHLDPKFCFGVWDFCVVVSFFLAFFVVSFIELLVVLPYEFLADMMKSFKEPRDQSGNEVCCDICVLGSREGGALKEFEQLMHQGEIEMDEWTLRKGVDDMNKWIEVNETETSTHLKELLSKTPPSQESLTDLLKNQYRLMRPDCELSSLSVVLLVRIAAVSMPPSLNGSLSCSLNEIFKSIHFIDRKMSSSSFKNRKKLMTSQHLSATRDYSSFLPKIIEKIGNETFQCQSQLDQAISIIRGLREVLPDYFEKDELVVISNFIEGRSYRSIEELYSFIEQLFVDMLNEFLIQLPEAIFEEIIESNPEDLEEKTKFALKAVCQVEQLETLVQWSFPVGTNITKLTTADEVPTSNEINSAPTLEMNINSATIIDPISNEVHASISVETSSNDNTNAFQSTGDFNHSEIIQVE